MESFIFPNGDLLIPRRIELKGIVGDAMVRIGPENSEYEQWLDWFKKTGNRPKKIEVNKDDVN